MTSGTLIHESRAIERIGLDARHRVAGVLLFAQAAGFMTMLMLAASIAPRYDVAGGAISDLGVIAETAVLFNGSLIAVGVANIVAGYLLHRSYQRRSVVVVFSLAGLGAIGAGLIPLDRGGLHGLFALLAFVAFNVEAIAIGRLVHGPMRAIPSARACWVSRSSCS